MTENKLERGMEFRDLRSFNDAMLAKQVNLAIDQRTRFVDVLCAKRKIFS